MTMASKDDDAPTAKKAKISVDDINTDGDRPELATVTQACWEIYRSYLDLDEDDDDDNDAANTPDEILREICERLRPHIKPLEQPLAAISNVKEMLPILASVAYLNLGSTAIARHTSTSGSSSSSPTEVTTDTENTEKNDLQTAQGYIKASLEWYPRNAMAWSAGANLGRMSCTMDEASVVDWYQKAAMYAHETRKETLELLETREYDNDNDDNNVKEWMELLLLWQVTGVQYVDDDADDKHEIDDDHKHQPEEALEDPHTDDQPKEIHNGDQPEEASEEPDNDDKPEEELEEPDGCFSASSVEATSRFMAAMLLSRAGDHTQALHHLQAFPLTHRLHPNVWDRTPANGQAPQALPPASTAPVSFRGGVLPPALYQRMTEVFAPGADYWRESDYANRGYYSFYEDIGDVDKAPPNLIHDVIVNHLLPLAKQILDNEEVASRICGYEWWTHSRVDRANLGHVLHFDTDDCFLTESQEICHPLVSSVLYLTGNETSGSTIVMDQTPESDCVAETCWRSDPCANSFMAFPGNLLHGVLPCQGRSNDTKQHRLTFMIGFKTRRVPDQRKKEDLYGPCGPLPPNTEAWVKEIERGYENPTPHVPRQESIEKQELPRTSPAWERIHQDMKLVDDKSPLQLPQALDHDFFVNGAPKCFREKLFDKDEDG
jgi:hypothetical protein